MLIVCAHLLNWQQGLEANPSDSWSIHSIAHVFDMRCQVDNGLALLESTVKDWQVYILATLITNMLKESCNIHI